MTDSPSPSHPIRPAPSRIGPMTFAWGERTFVMGILNVTPDSFSGDGLLADGETEGERGGGAGAPSPVELAVTTGRRMVAEGADILDVGGESTRPGHDAVGLEEERRRVVPVIAALRAALPETPLSIDTTKPAVAEAALAAGADLVNDVWGVGDDDSLARLRSGEALVCPPPAVGPVPRPERPPGGPETARTRSLALPFRIVAGSPKRPWARTAE